LTARKTQDKVAAITHERGFEPLEEYQSSQTAMRFRHLSCGREVTDERIHVAERAGLPLTLW